MENKYYIPSIEEFAFGLEYEYLERHTERENFYEPQTITKYSSIDLFDSEIKSGLIRVKYLDKEDIESLGYSLSKEDDSYKEFLKVGEFYKYYIVICPIFSKNLGVYINILTNQNTDQTIRFSGFIKNKLELSKLLKQLDIL